MGKKMPFAKKCEIQNCHRSLVKFIFSKKVTNIEEMFTVDLTLCGKCQIDGEDFVNFCGLIRKHELYYNVDTVEISQ